MPPPQAEGSILNLKEVSIEAVASHNTSSDAWIIINGIVCNVTEYLPLHPGGDAVLRPLLGQDATEEFERVGHTGEAERILATYAIGKLESAAQELSGSRNDQECLNDSTDATSSASSSTSRFITQRKVSDRKLPQSSIAATTVNDEFDGQIGAATKSKNTFLDLSKPLIQQVYHLSQQDYCKLVQEISFTREPCRMFHSDVIEALSRTKWFVVPLVWLPVSCYSMFLALTAAASHPVPLLLLPSLWILGSFLWTFFEYIFHRFVFHYAEDHLPNHGAAFVIHFTAHAIHHVFPTDHLRLVMPPVLFVLLSFPIYMISKYVFCIPPLPLYSLWSGGVFGYVVYDMIHYSSHFCSVYRIPPYIREMKKYHMKHHYKHPLLGFGVSTKFWDFVFGTTFDKTGII